MGSLEEETVCRSIKTLEPLFVDPYTVSRDTGSFILIDTATRRTVAAGMVREVLG